MRVLITGATGMIGVPLVKVLKDRGDQVIALSRDAARAKAKLGDVTCVTAELENPGPWCDELGNADAVIHLAGEAAGDKRWDAQQKQRIRDSRTESTRVIVEAIGKLPVDKRPKILLSASGVDYYPYAIIGLGDEEDVTEIDPPGEEFLARVCRDWEKEAFVAESLGLRVAAMRIGLVLGAGLAMRRLTKPFRWFVGGRIGSGEQWLSWIDVRDVVSLFVKALDDERYRGPINAVTESVRQREFAKLVGKAVHRPSFMPAPGFGVKIIAGEFAEVILNGRRVVPAKLKKLGFVFEHADLAASLRDAVA
jgi:uncharacterized protein (TIGR01777 family)